MNRIIGIIMICVVFSICAFSLTIGKYILRAQNDIKTDREISLIVNDMTTMIQTLKEEEVDYPLNDTIFQITSKYEKYQFSMIDVCSGINLHTLSERILSNSKVKSIILNNKEECVYYGWVNAQQQNNETVKKINETYKNPKSLYPIVNNLSMMNINYLKMDCIEALFDAEQI